MSTALFKNSLFQCQPSEPRAAEEPSPEHSQTFHLPLQSEFRELFNTFMLCFIHCIYVIKSIIHYCMFDSHINCRQYRHLAVPETLGMLTECKIRVICFSKITHTEAKNTSPEFLGQCWENFVFKAIKSFMSSWPVGTEASSTSFQLFLRGGSTDTWTQWAEMEQLMFL